MTIVYAALGVFLGVTVGAIPGLTGDMAISILLPFVYKLDTVMSLGLLIGIYKGSMFGGAISACSFGVPGTPASHKICTFILPRLLRLYKGKSPHFRRRSAAIRSPLGMWMISSRVIAFVNTAAST